MTRRQAVTHFTRDATVYENLKHRATYCRQEAFLMGMLSLLVIMLVLHPGQAAVIPLSVRIDVQPQPLSFLGFYDTVFELDFTVTVTNNLANPLPAGNLTFHIEPPSGKYWSSYFMPFPSIAAHASATKHVTFQPAEPGLYTFHGRPAFSLRSIYFCGQVEDT
jgi:hypothetical protein